MYYPIDENMARRSHEMMSLRDYKEGSATAADGQALMPLA